MSIVVGGNALAGPDGLVVKTFADDLGVFRFKNQTRPAGTKVTEVVVHETVTRSWADTVAVLKQRGLGVHFIADVDGVVYQHADLLEDEMWHASQHNPMSVGIETVNPYEPGLAPKNGPWTTVIEKAPWAVGGSYLVPTPAQAESVTTLVNWLSSSDANPLTIPQSWPGIQPNPTQVAADGSMVSAPYMTLGRLAATTTPPNPGILAHMYFGHGDGAWLVLYAWLRLEAKLSPNAAYTEAVALATGATRADLTKYFALNPFLLTT